MTNPMISPNDEQREFEVRRDSESAAAFVTAALGGPRRAGQDLAADRAGELVVSPRRRHIDLSTSAGRVRYGYLGESARNALAELLETLDEVDTAVLPLGLVASREAVRQALRLSATVDDELLPQCPTCAVASGIVEEIRQTRQAGLPQSAPGRAIESVRGQL